MHKTALGELLGKLIDTGNATARKQRLTEFV